MTLLGPLWFVPLHEAINAFKAQRFAMLNERVSQGCRDCDSPRLLVKTSRILIR